MADETPLFLRRCLPVCCGWLMDWVLLLLPTSMWFLLLYFVSISCSDRLVCDFVPPFMPLLRPDTGPGRPKPTLASRSPDGASPCERGHSPETYAEYPPGHIRRRH